MLQLLHYLSENQASWYVYLFPQTYAYNVNSHRSIEVSPFSKVPTQKHPGPATVILRRPSPASDNDTASLLYTRLELIRQDTSLCSKANMNLRLTHKKSISAAMTATSGSPVILTKDTKSTLTGPLYFAPKRKIPPPGYMRSCCRRSKDHKMS